LEYKIFNKTKDISNIRRIASSKKAFSKNNSTTDYVLTNDFFYYSKNEKNDHRKQFDRLNNDRPVDARFHAKSTGLVIRGEY
jgi:hypothetical protein